MASVKFLLVWSLLSVSTALQQEVQVELGHDVTLQCQIPTGETISVLKWSRPDLNTDGYVCFYRNSRFYDNYQHPSFHGRVKLRNPEMKDGDVSVILGNVTFNDTGTYECLVAVRNPGSRNRAQTEIRHFINLTVTGETPVNMVESLVMEREDADGSSDAVGTPTALLVVAVVVAAVSVVSAVAAAVAALLMLLFRRMKKQHPAKLLPEEESGLNGPADGTEI